MFSQKIVPDEGGTMIAPEGFKTITRHLYEHPEGVMQGVYRVGKRIGQCSDF